MAIRFVYVVKPPRTLSYFSKSAYEVLLSEIPRLEIIVRRSDVVPHRFTPMDTNNWRTGLPLESRQTIIKRIMDILQRHMPPTGQEGVEELLKVACRFEEKTFLAAADQEDYLRKISLKMISLETKAQATSPDNIVSLGAVLAGVKLLDSAPIVPDRLAPMDTNNWRTGLHHDSRQMIVNRIMDTLERHMPPTGQESREELLNIAWRFEGKIFQAATDQEDYLRKISLKMLSLPTKDK